MKECKYNPLHQLIADTIKKDDNVRADETTLNVIKLNGTKARIENNGKSKSYVWLFASAEGAKYSSSLLDYIGLIYQTDKAIHNECGMTIKR